MTGRMAAASRWFVGLLPSESGLAHSLEGACGDDLAAQRVSTGNLVEPLIDGEIYLERWFHEAEALMASGAGAVLLHAGWRLRDVAPRGRLDPGAGAYELLRRLRRSDVETVVRLSGHGFGFVNVAAAFVLRDLGTILDRELSWHSSNHDKLTIFAQPGCYRTLLGSVDLSKTRWDTRGHYNLDAARYLRHRSTHDLGLAIDGPAAADLAKVYLARHVGVRQRSHRQRRWPCLPEPAARPAGSGSAVQVLATVPERADASYPYKERSIFAAYCNAIRHASRYVYIEDQYVWAYFTLTPSSIDGLPDPLDLLIAAVQRGVDVFVVLPQARRGPWGRIQSRRRHAALSALSGAQTPGSGHVVLATPRHGSRSVYVHSKLLIVDDEFCIVGSANLNRRSMFADYESAVGIADPAVARELRRQLWSEHLGLRPSDLGGDAEARRAFISTVASDAGHLHRYALQEPGHFQSHLERLVWDQLIDPVGG